MSVKGHAPTALMPRSFDVLITVVARLFAMVGPFGVSIITARMLGPEDRGLYFFCLSLAQIAAQISNFGLHASNTYLVANRPELLPRLLTNSLYVAMVIAPLVTLAIVVVVIHPQWMGLTPQSATGNLAFLAALIAPFLVTFLFVSHLAVGVGRVRLFNFLTIFNGLAAVIAAGIVAALHGGTRDYLVVAALALLVSGATGAFLLLYSKKVLLGFDSALFRTTAPIAGRAYLTTLLSFVILRIGVVTLQMNVPLEEVGQFSIASQFFDGLMVLPGTVGLLLFPSLLRAQPGAERWTILWRTFRQLNLVMIVLLVGVALVLPWVTPLFFGRIYTAAVPLALTMLLPALIFSAISVISQYLSSEGYPWMQVAAWTIGFVLQAVLSYVLSARFGAYGVPIALAISSIVVFTMLVAEAFRLRAAAATPENPQKF